MDRQYVAIRTFEDKEDNGTIYNLGTIYPRDGVVVPQARINSLMTGNNARGEVMIVPLVELPGVEPTDPEKKTSTRSKTTK